MQPDRLFPSLAVACFNPLFVLAVILSASFQREEPVLSLSKEPRRIPRHPNRPPLSPTESPPLLLPFSYRREQGNSVNKPHGINWF
jgi:hypothetical protein